MDIERKYLRELQQIEEQISSQRIATLQALELSANEELDLMDRLGREAKEILGESEKHIAEKIQLTMNIQKHRELAQAAEAISHEKISKLQQRRARDEVKGSS